MTPNSTASSRRRGVVAILCGAGLMCALATGAFAQMSKILDDTGLMPEDISLAAEAAEALYTKPGVKVGEVVDWTNAETGASGAVTVTEVNTSDNCVSFRHTTTSAKDRASRFDMRRCQNAENTWVLVPN
jgi:hypothetical protein